MAKTTPNAQEVPGDCGARANVSTGAAAASLVASFLKQGTTSPLIEPATAVAGAKSSPPGRAREPSASIHDQARSSPPKTPTPFASLVSGVPLGSRRSVEVESGRVGSAGSYSDGLRRADSRSVNRGVTSPVGSQSRIQSPTGGANRLFHNVHNEWAPSLKKRRRVLRYPKRSDPVRDRSRRGSRAGNLAVIDGLFVFIPSGCSSVSELLGGVEGFACGCRHVRLVAGLLRCVGPLRSKCQETNSCDRLGKINKADTACSGLDIFNPSRVYFTKRLARGSCTGCAEITA